MASDQLNVLLTGQALATLQHLADQRGVSVAAALSRAISHEQWLSDEFAAGSRVYAENKRAKVRSELSVNDMFHPA